MPNHLTTADPDFEGAFAAFLATKREVSDARRRPCRAILAHVRRAATRPWSS